MQCEVLQTEVSASWQSHSHANLKFIMKTVKFKKTPLLYGTSFLLDIFGPKLVVRRRTLNVESDDGRSIKIGPNNAGISRR